MNVNRIKSAGIEAAVAAVGILIVVLVINAVGGSWSVGPLVAFIAVFALVWFLMRTFGPLRGFRR